MIRFRAQLYRDNSSRRLLIEEVRVDHGGWLHFPEELAEAPVTFSTLKVSPRLGNTPRTLLLPNGYRLETEDNDAIDAALRTLAIEDRNHWLHLLESRFKYVLASLLIVALSSWGFVGYGLPYLAKQVAFSLPDGLLVSVGEQAQAQLDTHLLSPSLLPSEQQRQIQARFTTILQAQRRTQPGTPPQTPQHYQLIFRQGGALRANALALPSGVVIVTDELVALAETQTELDAVLAHEIGHLQLRHGLRSAIQSSVLPLLILAVTGDVSSASSLIAALPTLLLEAGYSKAFEREADRYAIAYLDSQGFDRKHFARILQRLEAQHANSVPGPISSHPDTQARIEAFAQQRDTKF